MVSHMSLPPPRTLASVIAILLTVEPAMMPSTAAAGRPDAADFVLRNGSFVTLDPARPRAEALAARGDTILVVGSWSDVEPYVGARTEVVDLGGRLAIPGFIEAHGHFTSIGETRLGLDLTRARSWDDIVALVAEAARVASPGEWILGRGWHQEKWTSVPAPAVEGFPLHGPLSRV